MIASVVLAASVIGIAGALAASYQQSSVRGNTATAMALARQLMEEISSVPLDPVGSTNAAGWSAGQHDRTLYDTIDDYHGYTDSSAALTTTDGTAIDVGDGATYTRTVSVQANALPSGLTGTAANFSLVTVSVAMPRGQTMSISKLFTRTTICR